MKKNKQLIIIAATFIVVTGLCFWRENSGSDKKESPVVISEICAHNINAAYDDNGEYGADYIELYNRSEETVNLLNWGLSDDKKTVRKFLLPEITINPGQCVIVWASANTDDINAYNEDFVPVDVHGLNFGVSDGEVCILTDANENVADSVVVSDELQDNRVMARCMDDLSSVVISDPSPYYVEDKRANSLKKTLEAPEYSVEGGWFSENVTVELSAREGDIYYTLDGSDPDENSIKYTGPITVYNRTDEENIYSNITDISSENQYMPDYNVDKGTVIKSIAITKDAKSDIKSQSYFVGLNESDYENMNIISISFSPEDFFGYEKGIYRCGKVHDLFLNKFDTELYEGDVSLTYNYSKKGIGWEKTVNIEFFSPEHEKILEQKAGIRIHGGWTRNHNQKNFQIYARDEYDGNSKFYYDFFENDAAYSKLMLRAGGSTDTYVTKIRDAFIQKLVADRDIGTQRAVPCVVFLNGEYWGFYNLQETIGTSYIEHYYNVKEDNVIIIKNGASRTDNTEDVELYNKVVSFAASNDMSNMDNYRKFEEMVDIQSMIDYYAVETYTGNSDAYKNNYAVWRSRNYGTGEYEDGRWRWLLFDLDDSCGMNIDANTADIDSFVSGNWYDNNPLNGDELFSALIRNQEFKDRFISSFTEIAQTNFKYEDVSSKLWNMVADYRTAIINSNNRFRGDAYLDEYPLFSEYEAPYDDDDFDRDIGWIDIFFRERAGYIMQYLHDDIGDN